ncbi:MAG: hypothetical protein QW639_06785, partial [Candidatus Bathyarchaeia archaeon]
SPASLAMVRMGCQTSHSCPRSGRPDLLTTSKASRALRSLRRYRLSLSSEKSRDSGSLPEGSCRPSGP